MADEISPEGIKFGLEAWKTIIEVQQHFNTIEMQIRSVAISLLTATIGAAAVVYNQMQGVIAEAIKAGTPVPPLNSLQILGINISSAKMIVVGGLFGWLAFYWMDRWWYHQFLQGAVNQAQYIEDKLKEWVPYGELLGLSSAVRKASHYKILGRFEIRSDRRVDLFYAIVAVFLILIILFVF